jgi:hypothetical protein
MVIMELMASCGRYKVVTAPLLSSSLFETFTTLPQLTPREGVHTPQVDGMSNLQYIDSTSGTGVASVWKASLWHEVHHRTVRRLL